MHILPRPQLFLEKDQQQPLRQQPVTKQKRIIKLMLEGFCSELCSVPRLVKLSYAKQITVPTADQGLRITISEDIVPEMRSTKREDISLNRN